MAAATISIFLAAVRRGAMRLTAITAIGFMKNAPRFENICGAKDDLPRSG